MEIGEFVRTYNGIIGIINKIELIGSGLRYAGEHSSEEIIQINDGHIYERRLKRNSIVKHSKHIIDLIEEGDYVNGCEVITVYGYDEDGNDKDELGIAETDNDIAYYIYLRKINIKTILTNEQFEQNVFRLEE